MGPQEPRRRVRRGYLRQKQENLTSLKFTPNIHLKNFNLANPKTRTRYDICDDSGNAYSAFFVSECYTFIFAFILLFFIFQFELPLEEFEGKLNKSKLKLVLTNGKIQG